MIVLGINAYHGDASAAIVVDGRLVAAAEEERFSRVKHCAGFPAHAVRYCLDAAGVRIDEVDHIAVPRSGRGWTRWRLKTFWSKRVRASRQAALADRAVVTYGEEILSIHRVEFA